MRVGLLGFLVCLGQNFTCAQMQLPEAVTNNAAVALEKQGRTFLYSFYGLDSTKRWPGMHRKVFRCDPKRNKCSQIANVPDSLGRLASAASVIKNKAYLVGGYAVFENGKEKSSSYTFEFNPETESFAKKASIPVRIDDQIQGVWRDSLLYVVSGWSDSVNVPNVQVFNPLHDTWHQATPLPDEIEAKIFGGCGIIVGDTIYVLGGATFAKNYPPSRGFYKGAINPQNPTEINWIKAHAYPGAFRYRSGTYHYKGSIVFYGGSNDTYNYNGISYAEKKPVEPNQQNLVYHIKSGKFELRPTEFPLMDMRNIATTQRGEFYVLGGMQSRQRVSSRVIKLKVNGGRGRKGFGSHP